MRRLVSLTLGILLLSSRSALADGVALTLPSEDQREITARLGPGVVGQVLPSVPIQDLSVFFPLREKVFTYQVTGGPNAGETQPLELARTKRRSGKPAWRFQLSPSLAGLKLLTVIS